MRKLASIALCSLFLVACGNDTKVEAPKAQLLNEESIGHYCSMNLNEHVGPKAQLYIKSRADKPYWFSTVKQMLMFRQLPEEPKDIVAIYVTDMSKVQDWSYANADNDWIDATKAYYVIKSPFVGGMGFEDALPFSDKAKAEAFIAKNGGEIATLDNIPEDYIFEQGGMSQMQHDASHADHTHHHHHMIPMDQEGMQHHKDNEPLHNH